MITELAQLWLPILLSATAIFFLSFLMWMVLPHHRGDWKPLPDEDATMKSLRESGVGPGQYAFPHCSHPSQMKDPEWMAKYNAGPKGFLTLRPEGPESMGKSLCLSFVVNVVSTVFVAYVAIMGIAPGADGRMVFRFVATVAFLAQSLALAWSPIWFGRTWSSIGREMFDGLIYALATGGVFCLLWPDA
ncbi:MAG: hypothetical protein ACI8QS_003704 [Planctomycetota bacterium]|jgi:hypothetical protein